MPTPKPLLVGARLGGLLGAREAALVHEPSRKTKSCLRPGPTTGGVGSWTLSSVRTRRPRVVE